jgi:hypothetical protein
MAGCKVRFKFQYLNRERLRSGEGVYNRNQKPPIMTQISEDPFNTGQYHEDGDVMAGYKIIVT